MWLQKLQEQINTETDKWDIKDTIQVSYDEWSEEPQNNIKEVEKI